MVEFGRFLVYGGVFLTLLGALICYAPWMLGWFGKLPGDFKVQTARITLFLPVTSMILLSILISVGAQVLSRIFPAGR